MNTPTRVTLVKEEVVLADGSTLKPLPVKTSSDAHRVSLLMLFKHVADIHVSLVEIISEKFGIPVDDIHKAVQEDPRWTEMLTNPLVTDLTAAVEENSVKAKPQKPKRRSKKAAPPPPPPPPPADEDELVFNDDDELVFD
jgi:hypothetical protein